MRRGVVLKNVNFSDILDIKHDLPHLHVYDFGVDVVKLDKLRCKFKQI